MFFLSSKKNKFHKQFFKFLFDLLKFIFYYFIWFLKYQIFLKFIYQKLNLFNM